MESSSKRKIKACKTHHRACSCREAIFKELLTACQSSLTLRGHYLGWNDDWHFTAQERRDCEKEIERIEDEISKVIDIALKNCEMLEQQEKG